MNWERQGKTTATKQKVRVETKWQICRVAWPQWIYVEHVREEQVNFDDIPVHFDGISTTWFTRSNICTTKLLDVTNSTPMMNYYLNNAWGYRSLYRIALWYLPWNMESPNDFRSSYPHGVRWEDTCTDDTIDIEEISWNSEKPRVRCDQNIFFVLCVVELGLLLPSHECGWPLAYLRPFLWCAVIKKLCDWLIWWPYFDTMHSK